MVVTEFGIVTAVIMQWRKAHFPIFVTELGMVYASVLPAGYPTNVVFALLNRTPSSELYAGLLLSTTIDIKLQHPLKALFPINVTEFGMVIDVKPLYENASPSIDVTELGMVIDVKPVHPEKATLPMDVTEFGMVTEASLVQTENALLPIVLISLQIIMLVILSRYSSQGEVVFPK